MKKYINCIPVVLLLFSMCKQIPLPAQQFAGSFKGEQNGVAISASLAVQDKQLKGTIVMNGQSAAVSGTVNDSVSTGFVVDAETQKTYSFTSTVSKDELRFNITFPELNNQTIQLLMQRESVAAGNTAPRQNSNPGNSKDRALVGTWRYTEVLNSGYGGNYGSLATDYFMEFKADGTVLSWTGRSAGGSGGVSVDAAGSGVSKGEWYTEGKTLFLVDPATKQKVSTHFYAEPSRMMLSDGGKEKKVFERVK